MCQLYWRDTSIQGTQYVSPLFKGHLHSGDIVFVTSIEGTPLFTRKEQVFWVLKAGFNFHSGDALALKKWLTTKIVVKFYYLLVKMATAFKTWTVSLKFDALHLWELTPQHRRDKLIMIFHTLSGYMKCNDCRRFRGRIKEKYFICWFIINKPQPNLHSGTLALVLRVSPG